MPSTRKLSSAKRPFNPTYEDMVAACSLVTTPILKELQELKSMISSGPQLMTYSEIKQGYGLSRFQIQKFVREGRIKKVGTGRPRFPRKDLDNLIQGFEVRMSKV